MATLMTYAGPAEADAMVTRTGGVPLVPAGFEWPQCATCSGPMQFLAQLLLDDLDAHDGSADVGGSGVLSLFMCRNDPGMCDDRGPEDGSNQALLYPPDGLSAASVPEEGVTLLPEACGIAYVPTETTDYDEARSRWGAAEGRSLRDVLGQLGGEPAWLQHDEPQPCPSCARRMTLVAQLEQGQDHRTEINFGGGGCGYAYACTACGRATFLWQR